MSQFATSIVKLIFTTEGWVICEKMGYFKRFCLVNVDIIDFKENIGSELNKAYANNSFLKTSCKNLF